MENKLLTITELEETHKIDDPWSYETSKDDALRKEILLSEIPQRKYIKVLDVGCGQGFITKDLLGENVLGVDISLEAINKAKKYENNYLKFQQANIFNLHRDLFPNTYDLIIITGVLYSQYIGFSKNLVYYIIDQLLQPGGILVSVHIGEWYNARFPYLLISEYGYEYREYYHKLEVYNK